MGSSHSAYTYVETESASFLPGSILKGVIKILVETPTEASQMSIVLTCIGEASWVTGSRKNRRHHYTKRVLYKVSYPIWNFGGTLPQGQFTLPFSIQLENELVPSFKIQNFSMFGKVEYI